MEEIFFEIALVIIISAVLSVVLRYLKQPAILAYILTGIILGPLGFFHLQHTSSLQSFGQLGITLLLFMLGLELKLHELRSIGKTAIIAGSLQMGITFILGYGAGMLFGFPTAVCLYLAIALCFSSTIVIVKLLSDRKDLNSLHGKLAIGILLMQDFFAILTIIFMNGFHAGSVVDILDQILLVGLKLSVLVGWILLFSRYVFPRILHNLSKSGETLFLFSLAWVFAVTALVTWEPIGFSIEIGGFLAGLALANTHENYQIIARMKALRDFFVTIFFVILGIQMSLTNVVSSLIPALVLSAFVIFLKPCIVMVITGFMGFRKRTSFLVGISMAQISEFSLIILFLGQSMGMLPESIVTTVILVSMITFVVSTYMIQSSNSLYSMIGSKLSFLEFRKNPNRHDFVQSDEFKDYDKHVVLIGGHQMGESIIHALRQSHEKVVVVDFDPDVIKRLKDKKIPAIFGDIADPEIQERIGFERAKMVISTVPDLEDNLLLIEGLKHSNKKARVVVMAFENDEAKQLYKVGADYVVLPHLVGGHHLAKILIHDDNLEMIEKYKKNDLALMI